MDSDADQFSYFVKIHDNPSVELLALGQIRKQIVTYHVMASIRQYWLVTLSRFVRIFAVDG